VLTNALRYLTKKELTAVAVIANFHRQRVIPLMERKMPIFELTLEALYEGSRTSNVLLPHNVAARRAKSAVAEFPDNPDDLWKIKMRPERRPTPGRGRGRRSMPRSARLHKRRVPRGQPHPSPPRGKIPRIVS